MKSEVSNRISRIGHEIKLIHDSYIGHYACRIDYTPADLDHLVSDLIELKNLWQEEINACK